MKIFSLVLKSDNANGEFGFLASNCRSQANESDSRISFIVSRTISSLGSVQVNWEIRQTVASHILASSDFQAAKGSLIFSQLDTQKVPLALFLEFLVLKPLSLNLMIQFYIYIYI